MVEQLLLPHQSDEDTFATIWKQAEQKYDEHGNEQELGINGFSVLLQHGMNIPIETKFGAMKKLAE